MRMGAYNASDIENGHGDVSNPLVSVTSNSHSRCNSRIIVESQNDAQNLFGFL